VAQPRIVMGKILPTGEGFHTVQSQRYDEWTLSTGAGYGGLSGSAGFIIDQTGQLIGIAGIFGASTVSRSYPFVKNQENYMIAEGTINGLLFAKQTLPKDKQQDWIERNFTYFSTPSTKANMDHIAEVQQWKNKVLEMCDTFKQSIKNTLLPEKQKAIQQFQQSYLSLLSENSVPIDMPWIVIAEGENLTKQRFDTYQSDMQQFKKIFEEKTQNHLNKLQKIQNLGIQQYVLTSPSHGNDLESILLQNWILNGFSRITSLEALEDKTLPPSMLFHWRNVNPFQKKW
ncbi:MAG: hypothetical protein KDK51_01165, partial [Deltaproteobacteria bacterium]|nr:hypothetical protein [Deltaproteobacteria bacterium]